MSMSLNRKKNKNKSCKSVLFASFAANHHDLSVVRQTQTSLGASYQTPQRLFSEHCGLVI